MPVNLPDGMSFDAIFGGGPQTATPAAIGRNTEHAMQSGLLFGYVGLVEGMVAVGLGEQAACSLGYGGSFRAGRVGAAGRMAAEAGLRVANVFHAGDGNLHPLVLYDGSALPALRPKIRICYH